MIWQPEREWEGTGEPWEREGSAAVERGREQGVVNDRARDGAETRWGLGGEKVGVGTVKNPELQNPESWVRTNADARFQR